MSLAFNPAMMTKHTGYVQSEGTFNDDNDYIKGTTTEYTFYAVNTVGNKFSRFEEGEARITTSGGQRASDYRKIYVHRKYRELELTDIVKYKEKYYNVLQKSSEIEFGFTEYLLESPKDWQPNPPTPAP